MSNPPHGVEIMIVGEAWGRYEEKLQKAFVGPSGAELLKMLDDAKIIKLDKRYIAEFYRRNDPTYIDAMWQLTGVPRTNVFNYHPPRDDVGYFCGPKTTAIAGYGALAKSKYVSIKWRGELKRLTDEVESANPAIVICLGNTALWAFTGHVGIGKLRGTTRSATHISAGRKLIATYHPAAVLRDWSLRSIAVADLIKAKRESKFREVRRPERTIWIEPTLEDLDAFFEEHIRGCNILSVDIETHGDAVTCIGFAPSPSVALVIPFYDGRRKGRSYWNTARDEQAAVGFVRKVLGDRRIAKVFQNGLYDITFLIRALGIRTLGAEHDTMLCHHALQPESLKNLGFLGSIYSDESSWKVERKTATIKRDE